MREVGSLIQETGSIRTPQIILMWDISSHLAAIGVTSAIAKCTMARSAHVRHGRGTVAIRRDLHV
jgi:hypothetical protein